MSDEPTIRYKVIGAATGEHGIFTYCNGYEIDAYVKEALARWGQVSIEVEMMEANK